MKFWNCDQSLWELYPKRGTKKYTCNNYKNKNSLV